MAGHIIKGLLTIFGHFPLLLDLQMGYFNLLVGMVYFIFYLLCMKVNTVTGFSASFLFFIFEAGIMLIMAAQRAPYFLAIMISVRLVMGLILYIACRSVTSLHQN
ncbi:MAG: hypothetical protein H7177_02930 [Rhizobacter sp.]|nr:hypothetical protein [Bacteriovorax sp.]